MTERVVMYSHRWDELREEFVAAQDSRCAIYNNVFTKPYLDHCHQSYFVRGARCFSCNSARLV